MTIATRKDDAAETIVETAETTENAALGTDINDEGVMTAEDLAALCESRSETYSFLARLFREEVDEALLAQLNDTDTPSLRATDSWTRAITRSPSTSPTPGSTPS